MKSKHRKHPWDETMVIAVMVVSALCVLLLLASYITSVGQASKQPYNMATKATILSMLNSASQVSGPTKNICNVECTKRYEICIAAYTGNKLVGCGERIYGNYSCLCSTPARVTAALPELSKMAKSKSKYCRSDASCGRESYCIGGVCQIKKLENKPCTENKECSSGSCVRNVCTKAASAPFSRNSSSENTPNVDFTLLNQDTLDVIKQMNLDISEVQGIVKECRGNNECVKRMISTLSKESMPTKE